MKYLLQLSIIFFLVVTCKTQQPISDEGPTRVRQIKPDEVVSYHQSIDITIAWYPYQNQSLQRTSKDEWKVVKSDGNEDGRIPVILIRYPETGDSIWFDMNTDSEVLGKLLKHSLMTQEPIKRPLTDYLEVASCTKCHPADVEVDFNR